MLLNEYGLNDKDKWLIMPDNNVEPNIYQNLIDKYYNEGYKRINQGHYMRWEDYHDNVAAQNHVLDISYLRGINNLEAFWLWATNVDLSYVQNLNSNCLEFLALGFRHKSMGQFKKSNKIDLSFVTKFNNLKHLFLGPDVVSPIKIIGATFPALLELTMHYDDISKVNFECFPKLQSLQIRSKDDGIEKYKLEQLVNLRELSISGFPKSQNLDFLSDFENLEILNISGFVNITKFPDLSRLTKLKWLFLNCKGIKNFESLASVPNLEKIKISNRISKDFDVELFRPITESNSLKEFGYVYDYQTKSEERKLIEMFGDRYNPMSYQIFLLESGGYHIIK